MTVVAGAGCGKVPNQTKINTHAQIYDENVTREDGYKLDIETVINNPEKVPRDINVLHEKYINKKDYSSKVDGLSSAIQGELVCYVDEKERLNKVVENSNSNAFKTGTGAQVTLADVEKAYYDQDDINLNIMQALNDMDDDLTVFGKFNRNLRGLKFMTKLKMLADLADNINSRNDKYGSPYPKHEDISDQYWEITRSYCEYVDDRYRDEIDIKVTYKDDPENNVSKKVITKTTNRYIQLNVRKYYDKFDKSFIGKWFMNSIFEKIEIKLFEKMFEGPTYNYRDEISYLKDTNVED